MSGRRDLAFHDLVKDAPLLTVARFLQCLSAAHLGWRVKSPSQDRGGIIVVGPPGSLKSTLISVLARRYPDVLEATDLNTQALTKLRDSFVSGRYRTLVLPEMAKLYERSPAVAGNLEGTIRAMTAEGYRAASFETHGLNERPARALVVGAMTSDVRKQNAERWRSNGFDRRFLWLAISFDSGKLVRSIEYWKKIELRVGARISPNGVAPARVGHHVGKIVMTLCGHQPGSAVPVLQAQMLGRIYSVLVQAYQKREDPEESAMRTLLAFGRALGPEGTEIS